jgi:hypothetical protein
MKIKSQRDFWAGLLFIVAGVAFAWGAAGYDIGDGERMGPGYFPLVLGLVLAALGFFIFFASLVVETEDGEKLGAWAWRPLAFVLGANFAFGILLAGLPRFGIPPMGMAVAVVALTFIASLAFEPFRAKETVLLALILAAGSYLVFVWLLKLDLQVWPAFMPG